MGSVLCAKRRKAFTDAARLFVINATCQQNGARLERACSRKLLGSAIGVDSSSSSRRYIATPSFLIGVTFVRPRQPLESHKCLNLMKVRESVCAAEFRQIDHEKPPQSQRRTTQKR